MVIPFIDVSYNSHLRQQSC